VVSELWAVPLAVVVLAQISAVATSVYLHRALAHRSLAVHPVADVFLRTVLWLTTGQNRREWIAVHRKHHAFTDREGDPHSPRLRGFWHVQFLNVYYYMREARNSQTLERFAADLPPDRLDRAVFSWGWLGLGVATLRTGPPPELVSRR
jgi:stearoyl-CoA desaturase (delta-9 desaturase)